ncbi:Asp23/Gls24 family envelope stress response protein [Nonomuraea sp. NPDC003804]|uniref:Asp23/Gls24 family envelope stress response protein n=1 Tax=Nonomuraea sp. NPDC003804 TaxID=3154547 RepID=UPI0033A279BA
MTTSASIVIPAQRVPAEQRGRTRIGERVVSGIALQAAGEVDMVRAVARRHAPVARVDGDLTMIWLDVALEYPSLISAVAAEIRGHVARRVLELTGLEVAQVDVRVTSLEVRP